MPDLIPTAQKFYADLENNNTKAWWTDNRGTYDTALKPAALDLIERITPKLAALCDLPIKGKLFRPHRDVRFSKDKTPYKTHLHLVWMTQSRARQDAAFFFGIGTDYVTVGGGMMGFEKPMLSDWRLFADQDHKRINGIMTALAGHGFGLREPALKRVPSEYAKDHPARDLLRMKACIATRDMGQTLAIEDDLMTGFGQLLPLNQLLIQIAEA